MHNPLSHPFAFIDVETTGINPVADRIIEVGIVRVENGKVVHKFQTLVNPHSFVPPEIVQLTGISTIQLERAPDFTEIQGQIKEVLDGAIFVAHNARFDYAFVKNEFKRNGNSFTSKVLCTVKLSRKLFPSLPRHNLDTIIQHFAITAEKRHRAFDDAHVLWKFFKLAQKQRAEEFEKVLQALLKTPSLPPKLSDSKLNNLPESPGVYSFLNKDGLTLYIGKSKNIKERIKSHFTNDHQSLKELKISKNIASIETLKTAGELGALVRESQMIKTIQPLYNRQLRRTKSLLAVIQVPDKDNYYKAEFVNANSITEENVESVLAVFKSKKQAKATLAEIAFKHNLCPKLLGLEKGTGSCFNYQLDKCKGACIYKENSLIYNLRVIEAFSKFRIPPWPFENIILISEESEEFTEQHIVYKWFYLGSIVIDKTSNDSKINKHEVKFDYDMYKIIKNYIKSAPKNVSITNITKLEELRQSLRNGLLPLN